MAAWRRMLGQFRMFVDRLLYHADAWLHTRRLRLLLQSAPALVLGLAILFIVAYQRYGAGEERLQRYRMALHESLDQNDSAKTEILARKLVQLDPQDPDARYGLAWLAEQRGDMQQAHKLMRDLAPDDSAGFPRAHFWLANSLLKNKSKLTTAESTWVIHHLNNSLRSGVHRQAAHVLLATVHVAARNFEQVAVHLDAVVMQRPDLRLQLAKVYAALGRQGQSRGELKEARKYFEEQLERDPSNRRMRILWAQAAGLMGDDDEAEAILLDGLALTYAPELRGALSALYVAKFDQLSNTGNDASRLGEQLKLLQKALHYSANHPQALSRLATLVQKSGDEAEQARALMQELLAQGEVPATVHLILGTSAAGATQWDQARLHLELAYRMNPQTPVLLNNLAWVLAFSEPPLKELDLSKRSNRRVPLAQAERSTDKPPVAAQLERALKLVDTALEVAPEHPEFHATRGRVLMRMQRWSEALLDLELALTHFPDRIELHRSLAEIYDKLRDQQLAAKHLQIADRLATKFMNDKGTND